MSLYIYIFILFVSLFLYFLYSSYSFQIYLHRKKFKKTFINDFTSAVKGSFEKTGHFAISHPVVKEYEYKSFSNRHKASFSNCYNVVTFKTFDAKWELFFHLVKNGSSYNELMTIRVFPKKYRLKSEGNVEKNYSRLNIFTNNRYLTGILESQKTNDNLKWLIRQNNDILLISHNNLHFKAFIDSKLMSKDRVLDMVSAMNLIKNDIFREDVLEY